MPMQPQQRPRGRALSLSKLLKAAIAEGVEKSQGRMSISEVLRALEWVRYETTEAVVKQIGDVPGE